MQTITIIGILASTCTGVAMLPQLIKIIKEKKVEEISWIMLGLLLAGLGLWISYGLIKKDLIIVISNSISVLINISIAVLTLKYKK